MAAPGLLCAFAQRPRGWRAGWHRAHVDPGLTGVEAGDDPIGARRHHEARRRSGSTWKTICDGCSATRAGCRATQAVPPGDGLPGASFRELPGDRVAGGQQAGGHGAPHIPRPMKPTVLSFACAALISLALLPGSEVIAAGTLPSPGWTANKPVPAHPQAALRLISCHVIIMVLSVGSANPVRIHAACPPALGSTLRRSTMGGDDQGGPGGGVRSGSAEARRAQATQHPLARALLVPSRR